MNSPLQRFYRQQFLIESLLRLKADIAAIGETLHQPSDDGELQRLTETERLIAHAAWTLQQAASKARSACQDTILNHELTASITVMAGALDNKRQGRIPPK